MATPPHCTTEELRRSRPQRILLPRILLQRIRLPSLGSSTNCTPQPAPYCVAEPKECTHNPSARGGARIYGTPARPHAMHTARSSAVAARSALSAPSSQPASSPPCTAHPVAHPPETPMGFRCPMPLRTHLPPAAQHLPWWHAPCTRSRREFPLRDAAFILPYSYLPITHTRVTRYSASECEHAPGCTLCDARGKPNSEMRCCTSWTAGNQ